MTNPCYTSREMRLAVVPAFSLFVLLICRVATAQGAYDITDLGTLNPNDQFSQALGINSYGQVSGFVLTTNATVRAFLWTPDSPNATTGSLIDLGPARGGIDGGLKVDDYGQVLVNVPAQTAFGIQSQANLWTPDVPNGTTGTIASLGGPTGPGGVSSGYGLNSFGQVAGFAYPGVCFLWTPDLPNGPTGRFNSYFNGTDSEPGFGYSSHGGSANSVNDSGQVTGSIQVGFFGFPTIHADSSLHYASADIISPSYDPGSQSYSGTGNAINSAAHVAGTAVLPDTGEVRPFFYDGSTMVDISPGGGGAANGINSLDQVVGSTAQGPFIYTGGTSVRLIDLIDPGSGWILLSDAWAINDSGQIVGSGFINGQVHGFLMTAR
jgi:uncharacterized membrane protein